MDVAKAVSEALKNVNKWRRREVAQKFANKMWENEQRVRLYGCNRPGGKQSVLPRDIINALCWGVGDEHNRAMILKYKAARLAAERFCRRSHRR